MNRLYIPIELEHLHILSRFVEEEKEAFFTRNPGQIKIYRDKFIAAALCQGAALHYIDKKNGVKDFDIHFFYEQHPIKKQMSRRLWKIKKEVLDFGTRRIDFIRSVVPPKCIDSGSKTEIIRNYLRMKPTKNSRYLAEKAVVGLLPESIFGELMWPA